MGKFYNLQGTATKASAPPGEQPIREGISNDPFGPDLDDGVLADTAGVNGQKPC